MIQAKDRPESLHEELIARFTKWWEEDGCVLSDLTDAEVVTEYLQGYAAEEEPLELAIKRDILYKEAIKDKLLEAAESRSRLKEKTAGKIMETAWQAVRKYIQRSVAAAGCGDAGSLPEEPQYTGGPFARKAVWMLPVRKSENTTPLTTTVCFVVDPEDLTLMVSVGDSFIKRWFIVGSDFSLIESERLFLYIFMQQLLTVRNLSQIFEGELQDEFEVLCDNCSVAVQTTIGEPGFLREWERAYEVQREAEAGGAPLQGCSHT